MPGLAGIAARNANRVMAYGPGVDRHYSNVGAMGDTLRPGLDVAVAPKDASGAFPDDFPYNSQVNIGGKTYTVRDTSWRHPGVPTDPGTFEIYGGQDMGYTNVTRVGSNRSGQTAYNEPVPKPPRGVGSPNDTPDFIPDEPVPGAPRGVGSNDEPSFVGDTPSATGGAHARLAGVTGGAGGNAIPDASAANRLASGGPPPPLGANYFANYFGPNGSGYTLFGANPPNRPEPTVNVAENVQVGVPVWNGSRGQYEAWNGNEFVPVSGGATANLSPGATGGADGNAPTGAQGSGGATVASNTRGATGGASGTAAPSNPYASTGYGSRAEFQARRASDLALMGQMSNGGEPNRFDTPDERGATTDPTPGGGGWGAGLAGMAALWSDAQKNAALFHAFHSAQFKGAG